MISRIPLFLLFYDYFCGGTNKKKYSPTIFFNKANGK